MLMALIHVKHASKMIAFLQIVKDIFRIGQLVHLSLIDVKLPAY